MAKNSITDYDNTAANNTDVQSVDISEGCSPSGINNAIREVMADLADVNDGTVALTSPQAGSLTVTGDLTVDTDTLYVDSTNNRVGIGTASPASKLSVVSGTNAGITVNDGTVNTILFNTSSANGSVGTTTNHPMAFYANNTERMRLDSSGNLLVDGSSTSGSANGAYVSLRGGDNNCIETYRVGTGGRSHHVFYNGTSSSRSLVGSIQTSGSSTSYNTSSDHRLKENDVDMTGAIARVKQLQPKRFNFIVDADTTVDGFMAHEVQTVVPEAITGTHNEVDADGNPVYQGIDQSKLVPLLTGALQEAIAKIETLEAKVTALENA